MRWGTAGGLALSLGLAGVTVAQPRQPPPAPPPPPAARQERPKSVHFEPCAYSMVYITSKVWRECCMLCGGDDAPSDAELAEAEREASHPTIVHQYFTLSGLGAADKAKAGDQAATAADGADQPGRHGKDKKPPRNRYGGLVGLQPLSPRIGGFD